MEGGMAMRGSQKLLALVAAGALTLGAGVALASTDTSKTPASPQATAVQTVKKAEVHRVRGEVTAVEPGANTMVVKAMEHKKALEVGVDITSKTIIREGKARKTLADIKVGDRVWMKYEKANDKLVADFVRILKPAKVAAKSKSY
jgi:TfoX/Sxy family transcriptional regulator of competence genes